jgi:hypothetical protein
MEKNTPEVANIKENQVETKFQLWKTKLEVYNYTEITPTELVEKLKTNVNNPKYLEMRKLYNNFIQNSCLESKATYDKIKEELELLTIPVKVHPRKQTEDMKFLYNVIVLDFDHKDNVGVITDIHAIKKTIEQDKYSFFVFISPNGRGLKVIIKVKAPSDFNIDSLNENLSNTSLKAEGRAGYIRLTRNYYKCCWYQISKYMLDNYQLVADKSNNYALGSTYVSADYEPFLNENSALFEIKEFVLPEEKIVPIINETPNIYSVSNYEILGEIERFVSKYTEGRHNKTIKITLQSTYYNIPMNEIIDYCNQSFGATDHPLSEIKRTVKDFYGRSYRGTQYFIKEIYNKKNRNYYGY